MHGLNLSDPKITYDASAPEGFRSGRHRVMPRGESRTGASLWELPPGESVCPYHYELGEEEWLLVLEGRPTLRTPEGEERLEPLDIVFFPTGPEGAHKVTNDTNSRVRVLMWSEVVFQPPPSIPTATRSGSSPPIAPTT